DGVRQSVNNLVRSPLLGQALYYLNTTPAFLRLMYQRHVYLDETKLTPEFIAQKHQITSKKGARYAPAAFVTGASDPVTNREDFLQLLASVSIPVFIVLAENAPPKSKAEIIAMTELNELNNVETVKLSGTLGIHEEFPEAVTAAIQRFL
ncbi:MAG: alpha/beta hydrolase, partial [Cyanobacteria bacterium P01_A01_bin.40]